VSRPASVGAASVRAEAAQETEQGEGWPVDLGRGARRGKDWRSATESAHFSPPDLVLVALGFEALAMAQVLG